MELIMQTPKTTWTVTTQEGNVEFDSNTLLEALLGRVMEAPKADFDELIVNFGRFLQSRQLFGDMKFNQLVGMSFAVGYFYRVFLEKNDVKIVMTDNSNVEEPLDTNKENSLEENNEMVNESDSIPDSEESSSSAS